MPALLVVGVRPSLPLMSEAQAAAGIEITPTIPDTPISADALHSGSVQISSMHQKQPVLFE